MERANLVSIKGVQDYQQQREGTEAKVIVSMSGSKTGYRSGKEAESSRLLQVAHCEIGNIDWSQFIQALTAGWKVFNLFYMQKEANVGG